MTGPEQDVLAKRFEQVRPHLRSVAYRMLGSLAEAEDAVQESWLRLSRSASSESAAIDNLAGWLTTVVGRICLDVLRSRTSRGEEPLEARPVEPAPGDSTDTPGPEDEALLADSVGAALLVVLDRLAPAERLAFVLHDLFAVPFEDIALITERTPAAARQLASRARRRVRGAEAAPRPDLVHRHRIVSAFLNAARGVARQAATFAQSAQLALIDGGVGVVARVDGGFRVMLFTIPDTRITQVSVLTTPAALAHLDIRVPALP
ncbi:sigma-70 family RNA polymerase sigma factor [Streptomyces sp. NPDC056773]|uniref:sigma-70 family RNA polymerase sigma factor n=1 Tax=unclassified Streptomyces TaxID=2593676 RepID=UPI00369C4276